jgi:putative Mg2+ transporter-C (MgtC) family protein
MSLMEITLKLLLAIALGGSIGMERETREKPAGFRTNILICVGSAMMMILSGLVFQGKETMGRDLTRIAAGVITGIGFIGAGTIIQARGIVHGLTTAATLWAVAGLGLVVGAGYYLVAVIFTFLVIITLILFGKIEEKFIKKQLYHYELKTKKPREIAIHIKKLASSMGLVLEELQLKKEDKLSIISFFFSSSKEKEQEFNHSLLDEKIVELRID